MIEAIKGTLIEKSNLKAIIDVNGIEFEITIPLSTYNNLPDLNKECKLFIEMVIGEKSIKLYGFSTKEEKFLFKELRKISKIGTQTAISILSSLSVEEFYNIIQHQNQEVLLKIPGIGKKTALNIIVEMSNKIPSTSTSYHSPLFKDAIETLCSLGFSKSEAEKAVQSVYTDNMTIDDLIKESLKRLGKHGR